MVIVRPEDDVGRLGSEIVRKLPFDGHGPHPTGSRFFPDVVVSSAALIYRLSGNGEPPAAVAPDSARFLAPLVGTLLAVLALAAVGLVKRLTRIRKHADT